MKNGGPEFPWAAFLFLGIILTFATIFEVTFFSGIRKDDPGRDLLLVLFGGPYILLLLCSAIIIGIWMFRKKQD